MMLELYSFDFKGDKYVITLTKGSVPQGLIYTEIIKNSVPIRQINSEYQRRIGENVKPVWSTFIHRSPNWVGKEIQEFELNIHKDLEKITNGQGENVYISKQHTKAILHELKEILS